MRVSGFSVTSREGEVRASGFSVTSREGEVRVSGFSLTGREGDLLLIFLLNLPNVRNSYSRRA